MNVFVTALTRQYPDAKIWLVRGKIRDFAINQSKLSFTSFYIFNHQREELIVFSTKSPERGRENFAGIVLSRFTSLVESEYAKKVIPSPDWHLLVISLPKETNQRLLAFLSCQDEESCLSVIESGRKFRRRFLTGIKDLVSELLRDDV